jgi:hypothetical protein
VIIPLPVEGYQAWLLRLRVDSHSERTPYSPWFRCASGVQTALNALLIQTAEKWVLIDTGSRETGELLSRLLETAGCGTAGVTDIALTGSGPDKTGGLRSQDDDRFATASIVSLAADFAAVTPNIRLDAAPGPEPGHAVASVHPAGGTPLVHLGDLVAHSVQMNEPDSPTPFDDNAVVAAATRRTVLARLAETGSLTVGSRLPGPGFVGQTPRAFGWSPVLF